MKKKCNFIVLVLLVLTCFFNSLYIPSFAKTETTGNITVSGVWASSTKAKVTCTYTDFEKSDNPGGFIVFYDKSGRMEQAYMDNLTVANGTGQWSCDIDFNGCEAEKVKIILVDMKTLKPLCIYSEMTVQELKNKIYNEVPEVTDNGTYGLRAAFETGTVECFKYDTYTTQIAEYYITDEVPAHTGQYSCKVSNRTMGDVSIMLVLDGADYTSKVNFSCYVRSAEGISEQTFYVKVRLVEDSTISYVALPGSEVTSYGDWVHMSGELDLSQYSITEAPWLMFQTKNSSKTSGGTKTSDYYVDDILITSDTNGMFYDDMNYTPSEKADNISETASEYTPKDISIEQDIASLKDVYKDYFKIGIAVQDRAMNANSRYGQLVSKHFNTMTSEGLFKNSNIVSTDLTWDFSKADKVMQFAKDTGLDEVVGHVLIWENSTAKGYTDLFATRDELLAFMKEYITKVVKHFEGDGDASEYTTGIDYSDWHVASWDVVNEAAATEFADGYVNRSGGWYNKIGKDYVTYAFKYANELGYDDIELRYNDFGEQNTRKVDNIYTVAKDIQAANVGMDTVALQSHYTLDESVDNVRAAFEKISSLGVKMDVSEIDVSAYTRAQLDAGTALYDDGIPKSVEYKQAEKMYELFSLYKEYSDVLGRVTFWSPTDRLSFRNNENFPHKDYPGIFDRNFQAKPQYWAITDFEEYKKRYPDYADEIEDLVWTFENEYNYGISREPDMGKWTGVNLNYVQDTTEPSVMSVNDVQSYNQYYADSGSTSTAATPWGTVTDPAYGSTQCMTVYNGTTTSAQALGVRVKLSKEQITPGITYTISFMHMGNSKHGNLLYAFFRPFSTEDNIEEKYNDTVDGISWVTEQTSIGTGSRCWQRVTADITVSEDDFNSDGYTTLWLLARAPYNAETGKYYKTFKGEYLYLDDIAIYEKSPLLWDFEGAQSQYVSKAPVIGKWTGVNQAYIQSSTEPKTMSVSNASDYNKYLASTGSTSDAATPTGKTKTPADGSVRCMFVYNGTTTTAQAMGMRVKLSRADVEVGKTYTLKFWQMSNTSEANNIYAFIRKYDITENISEKVTEAYDAIPWMPYSSSFLGNASRTGTWFTTDITPQETDFDENGYTTLWIISRAWVRSDGHCYKTYKGEYLYIDDVSLTEKSE